MISMGLPYYISFRCDFLVLDREFKTILSTDENLLGFGAGTDASDACGAN